MRLRLKPTESVVRGGHVGGSMPRGRLSPARFATWAFWGTTTLRVSAGISAQMCKLQRRPTWPAPHSRTGSGAPKSVLNKLVSDKTTSEAPPQTDGVGRARWPCRREHATRQIEPGAFRDLGLFGAPQRCAPARGSLRKCANSREGRPGQPRTRARGTGAPKSVLNKLDSFASDSFRQDSSDQSHFNVHLRLFVCSFEITDVTISQLGGSSACFYATPVHKLFLYFVQPLTGKRFLKPRP